eukprot:TRINITY_DN2253_c0_g3_i1.p1 TRINITY_DN2253_c0_g3~~TRINITY_DN2253_c0_g3_i1.p1  ORF type:complete len:406 (+),score=52.52 TRINITY_DN2253_c0_g3_i1:734-1951(+)
MSDSDVLELFRTEIDIPVHDVYSSIHISVFGHPKSSKARFISSFVNKSIQPIFVNIFKRIISFENKAYLLHIHTNIGQEVLFGINDSSFRLAQGFMFVYNPHDIETWEEFASVREKIFRIKDRERIPLTLVAFTNAEETSDKENGEKIVSSEEARKLAEYVGCRFKEIKGPNVTLIEECFNDLVRDVLIFDTGVIVTSDRKSGLPEEESSLNQEIVIMLIGDTFVGKTSLISKLTSKTISSRYKETTDIVVQKHSLIDDAKQDNYLLSIIDTPGLSDVESLNEQFLLNTQGFIFMYSATSKPSFQKLKELREGVLLLKGKPKIPLVLVANKLDESERQVTTKEGRDLAASFGCPFIETSLLSTSSDARECFFLLMKEIINLSDTVILPTQMKGKHLPLVWMVHML